LTIKFTLNSSVRSLPAPCRFASSKSSSYSTNALFLTAPCRQAAAGKTLCLVFARQYSVVKDLDCLPAVSGRATGTHRMLPLPLPTDGSRQGSGGPG
jgi:hypothetical protein